MVTPTFCVEILIGFSNVIRQCRHLANGVDGAVENDVYDL